MERKGYTTNHRNSVKHPKAKTENHRKKIYLREKPKKLETKMPSEYLNDYLVERTGEYSKEKNIDQSSENSHEHSGGHLHRHRHRHHHSYSYYRPEIKFMRVLLLICSFFYTYGLNTRLGNLNTLVFGFTFPALFIISGYLVLRESEHMEKRILREIKRTAICFAVLFATYFILSLFVDKTGTLALIKSPRFWIDFLCFNNCSLAIISRSVTLWYVQCLLYAYIIIYLIYKLKLLKFDIYIAGICLLIAVLVGEFSTAIGFHFWGKDYISGNFLTRAIPYILIGCFIHREKHSFSKLKTSHFWMIIAFGYIVEIGEYVILGLTDNQNYYGHLLGMGIVAVGVTLFCFMVNGFGELFTSLTNFSRTQIMVPFYVCTPIFYLLYKAFYVGNTSKSIIASFIGIITLISSFMIMGAYILFSQFIKKIQARIKRIKDR